MNAQTHPSSTTVPLQTGATVAVIMRTKNRLLLLHRAFSSVLLQSLPSWHLYLVNDGGDKEALEEMLTFYRPLFGGKLSVLHHDTSQGMEAASNAALALVSESFFVIHDDDDSWHPDFLKQSVAFLTDRKNANYVAVTTGCCVVYEDIKNNKVIELSREEWGFNRETVSFTKMLRTNLFPPICLLMRASLLKSAGFFNASLPVLGDWEYNLRVMMQGDIGYLKETLAFYHHRKPGLNSCYSNTVTDHTHKHDLYNILLHNQWLRDTLQHAPHLLGLMQVMQQQQSSPNTHHLEGLLHHINHRLDKIELTSSWLHKMLRPVHKLWLLALPARHLIAKLRGRA